MDDIVDLDKSVELVLAPHVLLDDNARLGMAGPGKDIEGTITLPGHESIFLNINLYGHRLDNK